MPWYRRVHAAIDACLPPLTTTQATNLALLVSAILARRSLSLSELARAWPRPATPRVPAPKHDLAHRLKRLWRFTANQRVDPVAVQTALIGATVVRLGTPRWLALAIDWTMFDTILPGGGRTGGRRVRYQVLRIAVPRRGRALPLLEVAYDRDHLPAGSSQNQLEEHALAATLGALPAGVRPVLLADRGFARASFLEWLQGRRVDYVVRIDRGTCITEPDGRCWKLGQEHLARGQLGFAPGVRYGLYHGRPRELVLKPGAVVAGAARPLPRPAPQATRPAVVPGHQPRRRASRGGVVLAARLDRDGLSATDKSGGGGRRGRWAARSGSRPRRRSR